jgi:hypothetical protein
VAMTFFKRTICAVAWTGLCAVAASAATTPQGRSPVELTDALLDHWLAAMQRIGSDSFKGLAPAYPVVKPDPAALDKICSEAGFTSPDECSCTVLYVAVILNGFDERAKAFIDPAKALERRLMTGVQRTGLSAADMQASVARDRRLLFALRKALPGGVPHEHLTRFTRFFRGRTPTDVGAWREIATGSTAFETRAIGNRCTKLPGLSPPGAN